MGAFERERRRLARSYGKEAGEAIDLARPSNLAGDSWIPRAVEWTRKAAHEANRALRAEEERLRAPRIGPCRDPLELWFLELGEPGQRERRYYATRDEARAALGQYHAGALPPGSVVEGLQPRT